LLFEIVKNYSLSGNPESINCIPFVTTPPVSLKMWTLAYQWRKLNKTAIEESDTEGWILYYVAAGNCIHLLRQNWFRHSRKKSGNGELSKNSIK